MARCNSHAEVAGYTRVCDFCESTGRIRGRRVVVCERCRKGGILIPEWLVFAEDHSWRTFDVMMPNELHQTYTVPAPCRLSSMWTPTCSISMISGAIVASSHGSRTSDDGARGRRHSYLENL
ncbi:hypothetical protein BDU57DRAFT_522116 [Ampelomyces quisqualis]|uniref:Uncharacterized protein n=1 Tax=Ampelomyces quisqualis TaxID=50730 RepID=A0A6A5QD71_AMPQU|nr:hypothetical protein BDU57DRAFT_522116 [Ampelomyces quisqualis]